MAVRHNAVSIVLDSLLQAKLQHTNEVGGRPIRDTSDVLIHKVNHLRVFEAWDETLPDHLNDLPGTD